MKIRPTIVLLTALSPAAFLLVGGCSKNSDASTTVQDVKTDASNAWASAEAAASDTWNSIKEFTYERRADFSAGVDRMSKDLDDKIAELKAKTAGASDAASKDRDIAMKDYDDARADLKARLNDLSSATADTWADAKAKVDLAWKKVEAAYDKLVKTNSPS